MMKYTIFTQSCKQNKADGSKKNYGPEDEKWWGEAVLDGRNSLLNDVVFAYDQFVNCKANQLHHYSYRRWQHH